MTASAVPKTEDILEKTNALTTSGQVPQAIEMLAKAIEADPENDILISQLSILYRESGKPKEALKHGLRAAEIAPENYAHHTNVGSYYELCIDFENACAAFERALKINPECTVTRGNLGNIYEKLNRIDDAIVLIDDAPSAQKNDPYLLITKARLLRRQKKLEDAAKTLEAINESDLNVLRHQIFKGYELAKIYDLQKRYDESYDQMIKSGQLWLQQYDAQCARQDDIILLMDTMRQAFNPPWIASWTQTPLPKRPAPVQVVGYPRSGTTLIDQILQAHPSVVGMEETPVSDRTAGDLDQACGSFVKNLADLTPGQISDFQARYFDYARDYADFSDDQILLDKNPFNVARLGYMLRLFPDMKTIIMLRHPLDCILSCLMQVFTVNRGTVMMADLESAVLYYTKSFELLEHFQRVFPNASFYELRYEDLVENQSEESEYLLEFLELPWDEKVLRFYENEDKALVTSASYAQVNQPIYQSAKYRWKNYAHHFEPVMDKLQPWIEKFGYEDV